MVRWITVAALALVWPGLVIAEEGDAQRRAADAFTRATRYYEAEDYLAAAEAFEEANRHVPSSSVHFNIARSYELAELSDLAAQHYRAFLDGRAGNPQRRRQVQRRLDALQEGLGWVAVDTIPPGGMIRVANRDRGLAPLVLALPVGSHNIIAALDGFTARRAVEVRDAEISITLRLQPDEPYEPELFEGTVSREHIDDDSNTEAPTFDGGSRGTHHGLFWASLGLTVGSGVVLAIVGVKLVELEAEYELRNNGDAGVEELADLRSQGESYERATTALWITTGGFAAVTILLAILTDWSALRRSDSSDGSSLRRWNLAFGRGVSFSLNF